MVSLAYNIGGSAFSRSSVAGFTNSGNFDAAASAFSRFNMANHIVMQGLTSRRRLESNLFSHGEY